MRYSAPTRDSSGSGAPARRSSTTAKPASRARACALARVKNRRCVRSNSPKSSCGKRPRSSARRAEHRGRVAQVLEDVAEDNRVEARRIEAVALDVGLADLEAARAGRG